MFDPQAVQPVACSNGNTLEMDKDWELMSELDLYHSEIAEIIV